MVGGDCIPPSDRAVYCTLLVEPICRVKQILGQLRAGRQNLDADESSTAVEVKIDHAIDFDRITWIHAVNLWADLRINKVHVSRIGLLIIRNSNFSHDQRLP